MPFYRKSPNQGDELNAVSSQNHQPSSEVDSLHMHWFIVPIINGSLVYVGSNGSTLESSWMNLEGWFSLASDHSGSPVWIIPYDRPTFLINTLQIFLFAQKTEHIYIYVCIYIYIYTYIYLGLDMIRMIFRFLYGQSILTLHLLLNLTFAGFY